MRRVGGAGEGAAPVPQVLSELSPGEEAEEAHFQSSFSSENFPGPFKVLAELKKAQKGASEEQHSLAVPQAMF